MKINWISRLIILFLMISILLPSESTPTAQSRNKVKIGDYIEFGHYAGEPILWRVINLDQKGDPLLFADQIFTDKSFDARGGYNPDDFRKENGSNYWADSNIRQWLNSSEQSIDWIQNDPSSTNVELERFAYDMEKGFLSDGDFTEAERNGIKPYVQKVMLTELDKDYRDDGSELPVFDTEDDSKIHDGIQNASNAYYQNVTSKVFLLTIDELKKYVADRGWDLQAPLTSALSKNPVMQDGYDPGYWLNSPVFSTEDSSGVWAVGSSGYMMNNYAYTSKGIRPALYLDLDAVTFKSGNGSKELPFKQESVGITLMQKNITIKQGAGTILSYSLQPRQERDKINWTSKNRKIATVSENGLVRGTGIGTTTITATTTSGISSTCEVKVVPATKWEATVKKSVLSTKVSNSTVDEYGSYLNSFDNLSGGTSEFFDHQGRFNLVYEANNKLNISIFDKSMKVTKTISLSEELPLFGAAASDGEGNYYVLWGDAVNESDKKTKNIVITKYNPTGKKISSAAFMSGTLNVKVPFDGGNADMTYSNGKIAAYFARKMFKSSDGVNHQASEAVFVDSRSMKPLILPGPYTSHSFDEQVISTSDGGLLFVDRGDAYDRGFSLTKIYQDYPTPLTPFHFREGTASDYGYNETFSQLGGIAEGNLGYALVGSSEKTLSGAPAPHARNESRNLFIQIIKKDFQVYENDADLKLNLLTKGENRTVKGTPGKSSGRYFLTPKTVDYGVKWLTGYTKTKDVANPKVVATNDNRFVVMWEEFENGNFKNAYYMTLSSYGEVLQPPTVMKNTRLSYSERPLYRDGSVYWTVAYGDAKSRIEVYSLAIK